MQVQGFEIGIIGAGIGGLALAIGLTHLNVPFTVYEAATAFSAVGAGIGLGPNALEAMDLIDKRLRDMYADIATGNLNSNKKHVMMEAMRLETALGRGEEWFGKAEWGAPYFERTAAHRKDLLEIMASLLNKNAIRFNKRVKSLKQRDDLVSLIFEDGETAEHAAIVGADGVKGFTRRVVIGEDYPHLITPQYTGKYVYRTIIPMTEAKEVLDDLATDAKMYMSRGVNVATYPICEGKALNFGAFVQDDKPWTFPEATRPVTKSEMIEDLQKCNPDPRIVKLLDWAKPVRWGIFHHPITPTYYKSLVCIMGDVAHASAPHQGAGAGMCLEDALILSRVLGRLYHSAPGTVLSVPGPLRSTLVTSAFQAYDEVRRPRAQEQVRSSQECGEIYSLRDPLVGDDIAEAVRRLNGRFAWIWEHDLAADVQRAEARFDALVASASESS